MKKQTAWKRTGIAAVMAVSLMGASQTAFARDRDHDRCDRDSHRYTQSYNSRYTDGYDNRGGYADRAYYSNGYYNSRSYGYSDNRYYRDDYRYGRSQAGKSAAH